jgi:ribosome-associated protein YbcJ (S4-like RNA binding protein)
MKLMRRQAMTPTGGDNKAMIWGNQVEAAGNANKAVA